MGIVNVGDPLPLYNQLADYDPTKYVQAFVTKPDGSAVLGSPFNLIACDATGDYRNLVGVMPNVAWVRAKYAVFTDAGHTVLSTTEGGNGEVFFRSFTTGDPIPLFNQLADYDPTKYVRAFVQDASGVPITGSPFNLSAYDATGDYRNVAGVMPATPWVHAKYAVYTDSGYTTLSGADGGDGENIYLTTTIDPARFLPQASNIVAFVDIDGCSQSPTQDTIVQGSTRLLLIRLALDLSGSPFDITSASAVVFKMRNTDGTVLTLTLTDTVQIVNAGGGQIAVTLSAAQTALLAAAIPAPATIAVTISAKVTIVNLPTQLAVEEAEV